jgi:hypothetical protein
MFVTNEILTEYEEIIAQRWHPDVAKAVLRTLLELRNVHQTSLSFRMNLIRDDADDNKFADCAFAFLPLPTRQLFAETPPKPDTLIDAVEILRLTGPYTSTPGVDRQYQAQPIHIYPDQRPEPGQPQPHQCN